MDITICEKKNVLNTLRADKYDAVISINDVMQRKWDVVKMDKWKECVVKHVPKENVLFLHFWDSVVPEINSPTKDIVEKIVNFCRILNGQTTLKILIHCKMGISRSTAAAIIVLHVFGMEMDKAREHVLKLRPMANPNTLLLDLYMEIIKQVKL